MGLCHGGAREGALRPALVGLLSRLDALRAKELAITAWAYATAGVVDAPLFDAIARLATRRLGDLACLGPTDDGDESRKVFLRE